MISIKNEPPAELLISADFHRYPDMGEITKVFMRKLGVSDDVFCVLGNGCESQLKNIFIAKHITGLAFAEPCWAMIRVLCDMFSVDARTSEFTYCDGKFYESDPRPADAYYCTYPANNLFAHASKLEQVLDSRQYRQIIIDVSYADLDEIRDTVIKYASHPEVIIVGSLDKLYGCGLRLGFTITAKHDDMLFMCRDRYINSAAAQFICSHPFDTSYRDNISEFMTRFNELIISHTYNYAALNPAVSVSDNVPHKTFTVSGREFTRVGITQSHDEMELLARSIVVNK